MVELCPGTVDDQHMINDSIPWKEDLLRITHRLQRRGDQARWSERASYAVERDVMTAAYAIRKLLEARKVSDELASRPVNAVRHLLTGPAPDIWGRWEVWEYYDLTRGEKAQLSLREFCNQVIHSWVWVLSATDEARPRFDGIFISSDRERKRSVYFFGLETLIDICQAVGDDDIVYTRMAYNAEGERVITHASSSLSDHFSADEREAVEEALKGLRSREASEGGCARHSD